MASNFHFHTYEDRGSRMDTPRARDSPHGHAFITSGRIQRRADDKSPQRVAFGAIALKRYFLP